MVLNSEPGRVRTNQSKAKCSSYLTESVSCSAEPVELVPNRSIQMRKIPKFF